MINVLIFSLYLYWQLYSGNRLTIEKKKFTWRLHTEKVVSGVLAMIVTLKNIKPITFYLRSYIDYI